MIIGGSPVDVTLAAARPQCRRSCLWAERVGCSPLRSSTRYMSRWIQTSNRSRRWSGYSALRASDPFLARHNKEASLPCSPRWSGWRDLNPRPLRPERSALPSCATPRCPESGAQSNRDSIAERSPTHVNDGSGQRATRVSGRRGSATSPLAGRRSGGANRARYRGRRSRGTTSGRPICAASAHDAHQCRS